ncbi:MAG: hypothetical protein ACPGVT_01395 [Maricaulaceae bacterium]
MTIFERLKSETTPVVAYGIVFLLCVMAWLTLGRFSQAERALASKVVMAQTELANLENLSGESEWESRLAGAMKRRDEVQNKVWVGSTTGVVAANVQQALQSIGEDLYYERMQARADPEMIDVEGVDVLSFEFSGQAPSGKDIVKLFEALASYPKTIIIQEIEFSQNLRDMRSPRLTISGIIPVKITASEQVNIATVGGESQ